MDGGTVGGCVRTGEWRPSPACREAASARCVPGTGRRAQGEYLSRPGAVLE